MDKKAEPSSVAGKTVEKAPENQASPQRRGRAESRPKKESEGGHWYGSDAEEYDFCEEEVPVGQTKLEVPAELDAYRFPDTWDAAYHNTAAASKEVANATGAYFSAVVSSGIGQAGISVGQAALSTGSKAARFAAKKAITYFKPDLERRLPSFAKKWLNGPEKPAKDNVEGEAQAAIEDAKDTSVEAAAAKLDHFAIGEDDVHGSDDGDEHQATGPANSDAHASGTDANVDGDAVNKCHNQPKLVHIVPEDDDDGPLAVLFN